MPLAVKRAVATPLEFVVAVMVAVLLLKVPLAPVPGAANVTLTPETGLFDASFTVTASEFANAVPTGAVCGVVPALAVIELGAPAALVRLKFCVVRPAEAADTLYGPPAMLLAVNGAEATPLEFVDTVMVAVLLLNLPLAPEPGAVNVTLTPDTGLLDASSTVTASAFPNAVPTVAVCGVVPALAVIELAAPAVLLRLKFSVVRPAEAADTV